MKDFTPILVAALGAGVVYFFWTQNRRTAAPAPVLPSPQAFTEAPIFASDIADETYAAGIWT